jgi:serine/threonine protein kinase
MAFLHARGIVHGNQVPRNVLVDEGGLVRIGGLGTGDCGPPRSDAEALENEFCRAPEGGRAAAADVYAFGVIAHLIFSTDVWPASAQRVGELRELLEKWKGGNASRYRTLCRHSWGTLSRAVGRRTQPRDRRSPQF